MQSDWPKAFMHIIRYFQDISFLQNHKGNYDASCKAKNCTHQWIKHFRNSKPPYFGDIFGLFPRNIIFSKKKKNLALSFFYSLDTTTSYQTS